MWPVTALKVALSRVIATSATFVFVMYAWVFFRAETFPDALTMITRMTLPTAGDSVGLAPTLWLPMLAMLIGHAVGARYFHTLFTVSRDRKWWLPDAILLGIAIMAAVLFGPSGDTQPFIYFQF